MSYPIENFFPVYDLLCSQVQTMKNFNSPIEDEELRTIIEQIYTLDKVGRDMIYIIIRIHSLRNSNSKLLDIPYGGQKLNERNDNNDIVIDAKFDLRNFPPMLIRMLNRFATLHLQKLREDSTKK
jgi:hypothetical protein